LNIRPLSIAAVLLPLCGGIAQAQDSKQCALGRGNPDASIPACTRLIEKGPKAGRAGAFHNRGIAHAAKGDLKRAISDVSEGIRLDPRPAYRYQERGELHHRDGNYTLAVDDLSKAIALDPSRAFRYHSRANALRDYGDLDRAVADYSEAIRRDPTPRAFRFYSRAVAYALLDRHEEAISDFSRVLELEPGNASALVERSLAHLKNGDAQRARADLDAAAAVDPGNEDILAGREAFTSGPMAVPAERETFHICSRAGCTVTVQASGGRNGKAAWAEGRLLVVDAIDTCEGYSVPEWRGNGGIASLADCVRDTLSGEDGNIPHRIAADCPVGILTAPDGRKWRVTDEKRRRPGSTDSWSTWDLVGRMAENERPPFEANGSQFQVLCPENAERWQIE